MSFSAIVPNDGLVGYRFLQRTKEQQEDLIAQSPTSQRLEAAFRERIGTIETAQQLVDDRELLTVALEAFGLGDDIDNKYFIQKILEEGTTDSSALANKLSDQRYQDLADAFGFGDRSIPRTQLSIFPDEIIDKYHSSTFEISVGEQDESLRVALNADRLISEVVDTEESDRTKWLNILGNEALLETFQVALGLPDSMAQLDLDTQVEMYESKLKRQLGITISELTDESTRDQLIERYLLRNAVDLGASQSSGSLALTLLTS